MFFQSLQLVYKHRAIIIPLVNIQILQAEFTKKLQKEQKVIHADETDDPILYYLGICVELAIVWACKVSRPTSSLTLTTLYNNKSLGLALMLENLYAGASGTGIGWCIMHHDQSRGKRNTRKVCKKHVNLSKTGVICQSRGKMIIFAKQGGNLNWNRENRGKSKFVVDD